MTSDDEKVRLHIYLPLEEIEAIDEWGFKNKIRARTQAIRELVRLGLAVAEDEKGQYPVKHPDRQDAS